MKKRQAFEDVKTKEDLIKMFQKNIEYLIEGYINDATATTVIVKSLSMTDEQAKKSLSFLHHVDTKLNFAGQADFNKRHKIPTIVAGMNYIINHEEEVQDLSLDELMVLAKISSIEEEQEYNNLLTIYTKNILSEITSRDNRYGFREFFATIVEKLHGEGKTEQEILKYLQSNNNESLIEEAISYDNELLKSWGLS